MHASRFEFWLTIRDGRQKVDTKLQHGFFRLFL